MTALGSIAAGGRILASAVQGVAPLGVIKGVDETVTSSTTLQNDDALFVAVAANSKYFVICYLDYEGGTTGASDIKWQWQGPSGYSMRYMGIYPTTGGTVHTASITGATVVVAATAGAAAIQGAVMIGTVTTTTAGTLQLTWAQNTSSGTGTIVHAQSALELWQN